MEGYVFFKACTWMILYERHNYDKDVSGIKGLISLILLIQDNYYEAIHSFCFCINITSL